MHCEGAKAVTGSTKIRVWDLMSGELLRELGTSDVAVWRVGFLKERIVAVFHKDQGIVLNASTSSHRRNFSVSLGMRLIWIHLGLGCIRSELSPRSGDPAKDNLTEMAIVLTGFIGWKKR